MSNIKSNSAAYRAMKDCLYKAQKGRCDCCGYPMDRSPLPDTHDRVTFEHVIKAQFRKRGENHTVVLTCNECNQGRGDNNNYFRLPELANLPAPQEPKP